MAGPHRSCIGQDLMPLRAQHVGELVGDLRLCVGCEAPSGDERDLRTEPAEHLAELQSDGPGPEDGEAARCHAQFERRGRGQKAGLLQPRDVGDRRPGPGRDHDRAAADAGPVDLDGMAVEQPRRSRAVIDPVIVDEIDVPGLTQLGHQRALALERHRQQTAPPWRERSPRPRAAPWTERSRRSRTSHRSWCARPSPRSRPDRARGSRPRTPQRQTRSRSGRTHHHRSRSTARSLHMH